MRRKATIPPPWLALGISRATWYRLGKPQTKPERITQTQAAREFHVSVRNVQRARRIQREAPDLAAQIEAGTLKIGTAERFVAERQAAAVRAWLRAELAKRRADE